MCNTQEIHNKDVAMFINSWVVWGSHSIPFNPVRDVEPKQRVVVGFGNYAVSN